MQQASVQIDVIANLSSSNDLPLSFAINLRHHEISAKTSPLRSMLCQSRFSDIMQSIILWRNTLPPRITADVQFSFPARDCNCFFEARLRTLKLSNSSRNRDSLSAGSLSSIVEESISIPQKVIEVVGSTTFDQFIINLNFLNKWTKAFKANLHLSFDSYIRKSSKYATMVKPLRDIILRMAWESLWNMPGANFEPKGSFLSIKVYSLPSGKVHWEPVTSCIDADGPVWRFKVNFTHIIIFWHQFCCIINCLKTLLFKVANKIIYSCAIRMAAIMNRTYTPIWFGNYP